MGAKALGTGFFVARDIFITGDHVTSFPFVFNRPVGAGKGIDFPPFA
jgi:hypothetical protein